MRDNAHIILPSLPVKPTPRPPPRSIRPSPLGKPLSRCKPPSHCISARNIPPVNVKFPRLQREIFSSQTASSLNPSTEIPLLDRLLEGRLELSPSGDFFTDFFPHLVTSSPSGDFSLIRRFLPSSGDFSPHPGISPPILRFLSPSGDLSPHPAISPLIRGFLPPSGDFSPHRGFITGRIPCPAAPDEAGETARAPHVRPPGRFQVRT